jgi:hypothetical protein
MSNKSTLVLPQTLGFGTPGLKPTPYLVDEN